MSILNNRLVLKVLRYAIGFPIFFAVVLAFTPLIWVIEIRDLYERSENEYQRRTALKS